MVRYSVSPWIHKVEYIGHVTSCTYGEMIISASVGPVVGPCDERVYRRLVDSTFTCLRVNRLYTVPFGYF